MPRKNKTALKPLHLLTPEEKAARLAEEQIQQFLWKVKALPHWPEVGVDEWKTSWRALWGTELAASDKAYKRVARAVKNARYQVKKKPDPREQEKQAAVAAVMALGGDPLQ